MVSSSLLIYIRSFGKSWASLVSGVLSIPFTIASIYYFRESEGIIYGILAITAFGVASFSVWKTVYDELAKLETRDISVVYDPNDGHCMPPVVFQPTRNLATLMYGESNSGTYLQQVCIRLTNVGGDTIDDVEIYLEKISVTRSVPEIYSVSMGKENKRPITLHAGEPFRQGIIREIVSEISGKEIEITLPLKYQAMDLKGSEFVVDILVVGRQMNKPKRHSYRFGDNNGALFFEEIHQTTPPQP